MFPVRDLRRRPSRRAALTVEMAFVLPVLLFLLFGGIEFYRAKSLQQSADIAAYAAARHVIVPGATAEEGVGKALAVLTAAGVRGGAVTVTPNVILDSTSSVTVNVAVPLKLNSWIGRWFGSGDQIRRSMTLQTERASE